MTQRRCKHTCPVECRSHGRLLELRDVGAICHVFSCSQELVPGRQAACRMRLTRVHTNWRGVTKHGLCIPVLQLSCHLHMQGLLTLLRLERGLAGEGICRSSSSSITALGALFQPASPMQAQNDVSARRVSLAPAMLTCARRGKPF